ncbi:MAG: hypothetical protein Q4D17_04320 [Planctomycetia bacterium]|nr:hypothetical protein [Planctomycetia bacterium]
MKNFKILKFALISLFFGAGGFVAENVEAKGLFPPRTPKSTAETAAPAAAATEKQGGVGEKFWGKFQSGKNRSESLGGNDGARNPVVSNGHPGTGSQTVVNESTAKKTNPIVKFFRDFGKENPNSGSDPPLPSESAVPNANISGTSGTSVTQSRSWVGTNEPVNEKPPFEPSYGVVRSDSETVYSEGKNAVSDGISGIPDQVILEDDSETDLNLKVLEDVAEFDESSTKEMNAMVEEVAISDVMPVSEPIASGENSQNNSLPDTIVLENDAELDTFPINENESEVSEIVEAGEEISLNAASNEELEGDVLGDTELVSETAVMETDSFEEMKNDNKDSEKEILEEPEENISEEFVLEAPETGEIEEEPVSEQPYVRKDSSEVKKELTEEERAELGIMENQEVMPPVPQNSSLEGMSPDEPLRSKTSLIFSSVDESETGTWNKAIPRLEFMEKGELTPVLNVSPQRLAQPLSKKKETEESAVESLGALPQESSAEVLPRYGNGVSIGEHGDQGAAADKQSRSSISCPNGHFEERPDDSGKEVMEQESVSARIPRAELKIHTLMPGELLVGTEEQILFRVENLSDVPSEGSMIEIAIPSCFSVENTEVGRGSAAVLGSAASKNLRCVWNLGTLLGHEEETLLLKVIPTESASSDFQVSWSNQKLEKTGTVITELPNLEMQILAEKALHENVESPVRVLLKNTGNCLVKKILVKLQAEGCAKDIGFVQEVASLLPGEEQIFSASVCPTVRDQIRLNASAMIKNQVYAQTENVLKVNFMDLNLKVEEPSSVFVGMKTLLPIEITNLGNYAAKNMTFCVELPPNMAMESVSPEIKYEMNGSNQVLLHLEDISEAETTRLVLELMPKSEGEIVMPVKFQIGAMPLAESEIRFQVSGIANVQMELEAPRRVLSVSENVFYEIRLQNTGNKKISDAKLFVFFADGIEPFSAEQTPDVMEKGIVCFAVPEFLPGTTQTFRVQAGVKGEGNYPIRCQLKSDECGLDLIQQDTAIYR